LGFWGRERERRNVWGGGSRQIICVYKGRERERGGERERERDRERERVAPTQRKLDQQE